VGTRGDRSSNVGQQAAEALLDDLQGVAAIELKRMFGGNGVFSEGVMFGLVDSAGHCFLKADESTAADYGAAGGMRHGRMPYWGIPEAVRSDQDRLTGWATTALAVAKAARKK